MKKIISVFFLLCIAWQASAQSEPCGLSNGIPQLREVYVFSENRNHTMTELFGEQVPQQLIMIVYVPTTERKKEIDAMVMNGALKDGVFIFPLQSSTVRYCNATEYREALRNKTAPAMNPD